METAMHSRFLDVDGVKTHYFDEGDGPAVVLIHGAAFAIDAELTWFRQIESLRSCYRVIAFDEPGFGRTPLPGDRFLNREERTMHALAFLRALGIESALFVGHSEGGYMSARLAIVAPELVVAMVLVASGSTAPMLGGTADDAWIAASETAYTVGEMTEENFIAASRASAFHWDERLEKILRGSFRRSLETGHLALMQNLPKEELDMGLYMQVQQRYIQPHFDAIDVPTLLIWADNDPTVPTERGLALMRRIKGSDLVVLSGARHNVMHDRHEAFDETLRRWIDKTYRRVP